MVVKKKSFFGVLSVLIMLLSINVEANSKHEDRMRLLQQLDMLEALDFQDTLERANKCTVKHNFDCARNNIKKAKKFAKTNADFKELSYARADLKDEIALVEEEKEIERELKRDRRRMREAEREAEEEAERAAEREEEIRRANQPAQKSAWAMAAMDALNTAGDDLLRQQRESHARTEAALRQHYEAEREREKEQAEKQRRARREYERQKEISNKRQAELAKQKKERARETRVRQEKINRARQREKEGQQAKQRQLLAQKEVDQRKARQRQEAEKVAERETRQREEAKKNVQEKSMITIGEARMLCWVRDRKNGKQSWRCSGPVQLGLTNEATEEKAIKHMGCENPRKKYHNVRFSGKSKDYEYDRAFVYACGTPYAYYDKKIDDRFNIQYPASVIFIKYKCKHNTFSRGDERGVCSTQ